MEALIKKDDGVIIAREFEKELLRLECNYKAIKELLDARRETLKQAMEYYGVVKIDTEDYTINLIESTDREHFDKKSFKKDNQDLYDKYVSMRPTASSIRIKLKGNDDGLFD